MDNHQIKLVAGLITRAAVFTTVNNHIDFRVTPQNGLQTAAALTTKIVLGSLLGEVAAKHVGQRIDEVTVWLDR